MRLLSGALDWGEGRGTGTEILSIGLQLEIGASYGERGTPLKGGLGARLSGARLVALPLPSRRHRSNCLYPIVCQRNTYVWYVSSSQSLAATRKRRALLLRKKEKRGGVERKHSDPSAVSTAQNQTPWCIPRGRSVESNSPWGRGSRRRPTAPQARAEPTLGAGRTVQATRRCPQLGRGRPGRRRATPRSDPRSPSRQR